MKIRKYIAVLFIAAMFLPLFSAKAEKEVKDNQFNIQDVVFEEQDDVLELDFDTKGHLPIGFDPYANEVSIQTIQFMEEDEVELDFDTTTYLPENFDAYNK